MIPHRCPVCNGSGGVVQGFYSTPGQPKFDSTSTSPETCRSCWGSGVVWQAAGDPNGPPLPQRTTSNA